MSLGPTLYLTFVITAFVFFAVMLFSGHVWTNLPVKTGGAAKPSPLPLIAFILVVGLAGGLAVGFAVSGVEQRLAARQADAPVYQLGQLSK